MTRSKPLVFRVHRVLGARTLLPRMRLGQKAGRTGRRSASGSFVPFTNNGGCGFEQARMAPNSSETAVSQVRRFLRKSMVRFGGVGGFFAYSRAQVRKCCPIPRLFASRQTLMPEFDQPPFYIDRTKRHRCPVSYVAVLCSSHPCRILPICVTIYFRCERENRAWSRSRGFCL